MIFTSLGSNLGADHERYVSRHCRVDQGDDTHAWRVREVVDLPWVVERVDGERRKKLRGIDEEVLGGPHSPKRSGPNRVLGYSPVT